MSFQVGWPATGIVHSVRCIYLTPTFNFTPTLCIMVVSLDFNNMTKTHNVDLSCVWFHNIIQP